MAGHMTLLDKIKRFSQKISSTDAWQFSPQYKLSFNTTPNKRNEKLVKCSVQYGTELKSLADYSGEKVILLVGQTGAGKTTLINGFANYIYGVEWGDNFRLRVIDKTESGTSVSHSQTKNITAYTFPHVPGMKIDYTLTIVDTPGFGTTGNEGLLHDREISTNIKEFFSASQGIDQIHGVLFVTQASNARLTPTQQYVFEAVLGIFGNDIADHIFLMTTFADGQRPEVLTAIKDAQVPYKQYFKFNNSALYASKNDHSDESDEEDSSDEGYSFEELSWKMGMESFKRFFKKRLDKIQAQSLRLTKEVLHEREHLQLVIKNIPNKIKDGLTHMDALRMEEIFLKQFESEMIANKDYKYTVPITKQRKESMEGTGKFVTNCLSCNYTCHDICIYANDCDKHMCSAMVYDADKDKICCGVCVKKCHWKQHVNNPYKFVVYNEDEERTSDELLKRYKAATCKKDAKQQAVDGIQQEMKGLEDEVMKLIVAAKRHLERLEEIALRPINLSEVDYIDHLLAKEENEAKPGFINRVKMLQEFRHMAELTHKMKGLNPNDTADGRSVFEKLRQ